MSALAKQQDDPPQTLHHPPRFEATKASALAQLQLQRCSKQVRMPARANLSTPLHHPCSFSQNLFTGEPTNSYARLRQGLAAPLAAMVPQPLSHTARGRAPARPTPPRTTSSAAYSLLPVLLLALAALALPVGLCAATGDAPAALGIAGSQQHAVQQHRHLLAKPSFVKGNGKGNGDGNGKGKGNGNGNGNGKGNGHAYGHNKGGGCGSYGGGYGYPQPSGPSYPIVPTYPPPSKLSSFPLPATGSPPSWRKALSPAPSPPPGASHGFSRFTRAPPPPTVVDSPPPPGVTPEPSPEPTPEPEPSREPTTEPEPAP